MSTTDVADWAKSEVLPPRVIEAIACYTGAELADMAADEGLVSYLGLNPLEECRVRRVLASLFRGLRRE
jgi:hypothetical protein